MKRYLIPLFFTFFVFAIPQNVEAQFLKKLQKHVEDKVENEIDRRVKRRADKAVDDNLDKVEDAIDGKNEKNKENSNNDGTSKSNSKTVSNNNELETEKPNTPTVNWSRFDFVPGDKVIFEDSPGRMEENGEFPSRWDLFEGGAEVAEVDGEPVIMFIADAGNMHRKGIVPYLKNSKEDYLPEVFTIEFDAYYPPKVYNNRYYLTFYDRKNQKRVGMPQIEFNVNSVEAGSSESTYKGKNKGNWDDVGGWRHFSIAYTKGKLKVYLDDQRMINIPHAEGNPTGITIAGAFKDSFIKNIRIAKGGVKYYDRVLSEGKIIVNGIRFDVNKATIKPESMGAINKIYQLMSKQSDLNFSVEGHTDADGNDENNMKLSKARGKAVMEKLIAMGISSNRLKYNGFGESKPIDNNSTPEGKANNRRVEFVKF
ncbi:MAG: OmpA family protein [Bacteroidota bacterium]